MSSCVFVRKQSTQFICTRHTPAEEGIFEFPSISEVVSYTEILSSFLSLEGAEKCLESLSKSFNDLRVVSKIMNILETELCSSFFTLWGLTFLPHLHTCYKGRGGGGRQPELW